MYMGRFVNSEVNVRPSKLFFGGVYFWVYFFIFPITFTAYFFCGGLSPQTAPKENGTQTNKSNGKHAKVYPSRGFTAHFSFFWGGAGSPPDRAERKWNPD